MTTSERRLPPTRIYKADAPWIGGGYRVQVGWTPGYDCRTECRHDKKGEHGHHGDELRLALVRGDGALMTHLYLATRDGQYSPDWYQADRYTWPVGVSLCAAWPVEPETVRLGREARDCPYIGCCYQAWESTIEMAATVWTAEDERLVLDDLPRPPIEEIVVDKRLPVWTRMRDVFGEVYTDARKQHLALPERCGHCGGTGLIRGETRGE